MVSMLRPRRQCRTTEHIRVSNCSRLGEDDGVVAITASDRVLAFATGQTVSTSTTLDLVSTITTTDGVVTGTTVQDVSVAATGNVQEIIRRRTDRAQSNTTNTNSQSITSSGQCCTVDGKRRAQEASRVSQLNARCTSGTLSNGDRIDVAEVAQVMSKAAVQIDSIVTTVGRTSCITTAIDHSVSNCEAPELKVSSPKPPETVVVSVPTAAVKLSA